MPAAPRTSAARLAAGWVGLFAAAAALAQPPDAKKPADVPKALPAPKDAAPEPPKDAPRAAPPVGLKLPDGTFLWTGPGPAGDGERVLLTPQEHQKLLDQIDQLKKQLAARKAVPPGGCAVRGGVVKRGETAVAALKLTFTFRTAAPNTAVSLGGKRAFLVAASLDNAKLPVLDTGDDGFVALVEAAGDHTLVLDVEDPITGRGPKTEIGFELGLPRAAITTLALDPPPGVARVTLVTRTPDVPKPAERRVPGLDAKALAPPPPGRDPYPLGPVESLEVTWEPPAAAAPAEAVQAADLDVTVRVAEGFVETAARFHPTGPARVWRIAAPADAVVTVDRVAGTDTGPAEAPAVTKPADPARPIWTVTLPAGTAAADWVVIATVTAQRAKADDPRHAGPFPVGPLAVLDVARQTGKVKVTAAANTRLVVKHGADLRQDVAPGPASEDESAAFFRLATGPSGNAPPAGPLFTVGASPIPGKVLVRPVYRLTRTDAGWAVRAELKVSPVNTAVEAVTIELPAGWRGPEVSPQELVAGTEQLKADAARQVLAVRLLAEHKKPFDLVLSATVPVPPGAREAAVLLPRFPAATERDAVVTATVHEGAEVRGTAHAWDGDQPAAWGQPLTPTPGPDGKPPKAVTAVTGKFDRGLARLDLAWSAYRPELTADVQAQVTVHDAQVVVVERVRLKAPDGFTKAVRFRGPAAVKGLKPAFDSPAPGEWTTTPAADAKEAEIRFAYALPLPPRPADGGPWKVPVGLLWPADTTRTESVVLVWPGFATGRAVGADPGPWRELPPEPVKDKDVLPALTLAGSGADLPLVLDLRDVADTAGATVWVDRALIQAWAGDDGTTTYKARFLLKRWLTDSVEVRLPATATTPEVFLHDPPRPVNALPVSAGGERAIRVPLPEAASGKTVVVELRYKTTTAAGEDAMYAPPRPGAAFAGPVRWQITVPGGRVPLVLGGGRAEQRWQFRAGLLAPASASDDDLTHWFQTGQGGDDAAGAAESVVVRTTGPEAVRVEHVARLNLIVACSVGVLLVGLIVVRLPGGVSGPVVAVLAGAAAVGAVLYPQPAGQAAGAAVPGFAALVLVLTVQTAARWYYRRRVTYLPGFARARPDLHAPPAAAVGSKAPSGGSRPSPNGSTGPADAAVAATNAPSGS